MSSSYHPQASAMPDETKPEEIMNIYFCRMWRNGAAGCFPLQKFGWPSSSLFSWSCSSLFSSTSGKDLIAFLYFVTPSGNQESNQTTTGLRSFDLKNISQYLRTDSVCFWPLPFNRPPPLAHFASSLSAHIWNDLPMQVETLLDQLLDI